MLAHGLFVVAQQVRHVGDWHAALQKNSREGVPETMRRRRFLELARQLEHLSDFSSPHVGDGFEPIRMPHDKRTHTAPLGARSMRRSRSQSGM